MKGTYVFVAFISDTVAIKIDFKQLFTYEEIVDVKLQSLSSCEM